MSIQNQYRIRVHVDGTLGTGSERAEVCGICFRDNKTVATSVASLASSKVLHQGDVATTEMVTDTDHDVKRYSVLKDDEWVDSQIRGLTEDPKTTHTS